MATSKGKTAAWLLFRDVERQSRVSALSCSDLALGAAWAAADLTSTSVGSWEPSYDTERWKNERYPSLFVQRTGQGDGETLENLPPQPVAVLDWLPGPPVRPVALASAATSEEYKLVWADEFDQAGRPDPAKLVLTQILVTRLVDWHKEASLPM